MPLPITGQPPSSEVRAQLAETGETVLLAFSRGKDSIAAWLALRDAGIPVIPFHWEGVPGMRFVRDDLDYWEQYFGVRIHVYPHPSFWRQLRNYVFQPPERYEVIEAMKIPRWDVHGMEHRIRADLGLPAGTWVVDGNRASDTMARRTNITRMGYMRSTTGKASLIGDWRAAEVRAFIDHHGARLPIDYKIWGRSFDGLGHHYVRPLLDHLPADYEVVRDWFPLIDLELMRREMNPRHPWPVPPEARYPDGYGTPVDEWIRTDG